MTYPPSSGALLTLSKIGGLLSCVLKRSYRALLGPSLNFAYAIDLGGHE